MNINQLVNDLYPKKRTVLQMFLDSVRTKYTSLSQLKGTYDEYGRLVAWHDDEEYDPDEFYDENVHNFDEPEDDGEEVQEPTEKIRSSGRKRKNNNIENEADVCFKLKVVRYAKDHGNRKAAKTYDVKLGQVRDWLERENEFLEILRPTSTYRSKRCNKKNSSKTTRLIVNKKSIRVKLSKKKQRQTDEYDEDDADDREEIYEETSSSRKSSKNSKMSYSDLPRLHRQDVESKQLFAKKSKSEYDLDFKLEAINYSKLHGNFAACRQFDISPPTLNEWKIQEELLNGKEPPSNNSPPRRLSDRLLSKINDPIKKKIFRKITMESPLSPFEMKSDGIDCAERSDEYSDSSVEEYEDEEEEEEEEDGPPSLNADGLFSGDWND